MTTTFPAVAMRSAGKLLCLLCLLAADIAMIARETGISSDGITGKIEIAPEWLKRKGGKK